jgi:hypothetical protein
MPNTNIACRLIKASNLAYGISADGTRFEPEYDQEIAAIGFNDRPKIFQSPKDKGIDACYFGETDDLAILAFRGTLPPSLKVDRVINVHEFLRILLDWLNDAELAQVQGHNLPGLVHKGFLDSLDNLWQAIEHFNIPDAIKAGKAFYITGHSKGGGLTYLAAMRFLLSYDIAPSGVFSYAAPRVGNSEFALAYDARLKAVTRRFEFQDDIVPHLPPHTASWLSALRGAQKASGKITPVISDMKIANIKSSFDLLLNRIEQINAKMSNHGDLLQSYVSAGTLNFIDWDSPPVLEGDSWKLNIDRDLHMAGLILTFDFERIISDHSSSEGYMNYPCTTVQLPEIDV